MSDKFFKKTGKNIFLIIVANIFALYLISSVPIFYETVSADDPEFWLVSPTVSKKAVINNPDNQSMIKTRIHYNFYTMQKRDDNNIKLLSEDITYINYCIWAGLIFSIVAFIGLILYSTKQYPKKALIIMCLGFFVILFAILSLYLQWSFINAVNNVDEISFSSMWKPDSNLQYIYLVFFVGIISFFGSLNYFGKVGFRFLNQRKEVKKREAYEKLVNKKEEPEIKTEVKDQSAKPFFNDSEDAKAKVLSNNDGKKMDLDTAKIDDGSIHNQNIERESFFGEEEKEDETDELEKSGEEKVESDVFESKSVDEESVSYKEVKIRCPKCKHVFKVKKKNDGVTHMYCPQCGQKGVLK